MRDRLPSLYRPDDGDQSLLSVWLGAVATVLDRARREADDVLRSHWFPYADGAAYQPYVLRTRMLQGVAPLVPLPTDPAVALFPYIQDLARLAMLLPVTPWQQPPAVSETVEEYRLRIRRIVAIYRRGLGALGTLRDIVEAQLPANRGAPPDQIDRPFWLEEFAPLVKRSAHVQGRGEPLDLVGPLMRWTINNDGLKPAAPTIYIQGVEVPGVQPQVIDATVRPLIELYQTGGRKVRVGIGYSDTLGPTETLRLRPAYTSWLGTASGLQAATSLPTDTHAADPTAPGPWTAVAGGPAASISAILQTADLTLWVATTAGGAGALHAFNGTAWSDGPSGLPAIHALAEDSGDVLIGAETGLLRMTLHPPSGPVTATPVAAFAGHRVNALFRASDGTLWLGCDNGALTLGAGDAAVASPLLNTEVFCVAEDHTGALYFGCALGLFQWQTAANLWFWYEGKNATGQATQWQPFFPGKPAAQANFPSAQQPFLPPVLRIWRGRDAGLWLGTQNGMARYTAIEQNELQFEPRLEAFPDIATGPVTDLREDDRGLVWFATGQGLFRYDGRDLWQHRAAGWVQTGRADTMYPAAADRGPWRFNRATSSWERLDTVWTPFSGAPRSTAEAPVTALAWTGGVTADVGQWDGSSFSNATPVATSKLAARYKPSEDRIVAGGIPGIPRIPRGDSVWRYLSIEPAALTPPSADRPWWTAEGRLVLPPPTPDAPGEGRYDVTAPPPPSDFDQAVFTYNPAAGVWFEWQAARPLTVLVRLKTLTAGENIDPSVTERVFSSLQQVRPAGVRVAMTIEEDPVKTT
jgi:hypothetical protein